ncbi:MAG: nucleotidyltransferase, partial [Candidatus Dormibacteraeota bacterium]|nr:nucleotidyltransferase [Candidatus Dormibacteraeota bacterium]MBO0762450.1 nucleotidyltransferase [Candidatus Dormibacteraeota bacterium]
MEHEMEEALARAASTLEDAGITYALMGGLASAAVGRARATRDVDLFLPAGSAEAALDALAAAGFQTERTDPAWLFKAFWRGVLVDLIFKSKGGVRLDGEMAARRRRITVGDTEVPALAREDILVIKALANAEHVPRHWHDALGIVEANEIDWEYLLWRAQGHPHRVLSLLAYAASDGLPVPSRVLRSLHEIGEEAGRPGSPRPAEEAASR